MSVTITVKTDLKSTVADILADGAPEAERVVAEQVMKDTDPYVPFRNGKLHQMTRVVGNSVIYQGPYARYLYYGKKMVNAATGKGPRVFYDDLGNKYIRFPKHSHLKPTNIDLEYTKDFHPLAGPYWFERSKKQNLNTWLKVAKEAVTKYA